MRTVVTPEEQKRVNELEEMKKSLEVQLQEMAKRMKEQQEQIAMARRDPLTGLRNRDGVAEQVDTCLIRKRQGAFFIIDMDNFKNVNDTYGHIEGDKVLVRFADALRKAAMEEEIVARIGGDEFIIFIPQVTERKMIHERAARIVKRIEREMVIPGRLVRITVSLGVALAPKDGITFDMLYTNADKALYLAKREGKNAYRFYDEVVEPKEKKTIQRTSLTDITTRLRERKMEGSFVVEYDSFEKIYRFLERNISREKREVQCILFTIEEPEEDGLDTFEMQRRMEHLQHAVTSALRKGDVTTQYSSSQMLALLMDTNEPNAQGVVERILGRFEELACVKAATVRYEIDKLLSEEEVV